MTRKTVGLTTGQAARYCLVSTDTMANWIKAKELPAQRTVGGQFRILVADLRRFMVQKQMSTALLDSELNCRPYCWECHQSEGEGAGTPNARCRECPVYRTKALNCFELRAMISDWSWPDASCRDCAYFLSWADQQGNE